MLTSRRLILIDNSVNPFHLRTIPLESIITVFAGTDVKGDPIFTLSHMDPTGTGAPHPMDFIFTRQKGEQRAKECKEWASTLSNHASGARNGALSAGTLPYDPVKVIQPQMSATYRIETFSPRKTVAEEYPVRAEPVPTEDLLKIPADDEIPTGTHAPPIQENTEMGESFDISRLPPPDLEETVIPGTEELVSSPPVIAINADENPSNTDAAQAWADAVRTVTTPLPVIPLTMASETIPAEENIDDNPEADADQSNTTPEVPMAEIIKDDRSVDTMILKCPATDDSVEPPTPKADTVPAAISPPASKIPKSASTTFQIATIVIVILVVLGATVISSFYLTDSGEIPPPVVVPIITVLPTPTPIQTLIPADGVWVRIESPGAFIGEVGNTELMHPVSGSGVRFYKILWSDRLVKVSAQKQENSGDTLLIEIYNNGTLIKHSSTRAPMGSIYILIDPITGQPPGLKL